MSHANKLRFYIDQASMTRDYAALAIFEGRLGRLEESRTNSAVDGGEDTPLSVEAARGAADGSPGRLEPEQATWFGLFGAQARVNP